MRLVAVANESSKLDKLNDNSTSICPHGPKLSHAQNDLLCVEWDVKLYSLTQFKTVITLCVFSAIFVLLWC